MAWTQIWDGLLLRKQQTPGFAYDATSNKFAITSQFLPGNRQQNWMVATSYHDLQIPGQGWYAGDQKLLFQRSELYIGEILPGYQQYMIGYITKNSPLEQTYIIIWQDL